MVQANKEQDLLVAACLQAMQTRWPDCQPIASQIKSDGAIDFLAERSDGSLVIAGKKKGVRLNLKWELASVSSEAVKAILQALKLKRSICFVSYSARKVLAKSGAKKHVDTKVSLAKSESKLQWQKIFPDDPLPEAFQWTIDKQEVKKRGDCLVVLHHFKNGRARQINEYQLPLKNISMAVYESTIMYNTFPFNIPHSHKVTDDKQVTYDRGIDQWEEHASQKGLLDNSTVQKKTCNACKVHFYDTSSQEFCYGCMIGRQSDAQKEAIKLCKLAEKYAKESDWKASADKLKELQQQWQQLKNIPRDQNEKLWTRFQSANQGFFDRRSEFFDKMDKQREGNFAKAKKLIKAAQKAVSNKDKYQAREDIKALQQQWKQVNPLPREHSDALWTEFRGTCQTVFNNN
jgi:hypothetical protein